MTAGNFDDRKLVLDMIESVTGSLYAEKDYASACRKEELSEQGFDFIKGQLGNMECRLISSWDRVMLSSRFIIETVCWQPKNMAQIDHTRHRSCISFRLI